MKRIFPMAWIPTIYIAEGLPYVAVNTLSVIMYKNMGMSNADIAFYTGWLYLPWVIKPFWSPFIDIIRTKRWWTVTMQFAIGAAFAAIALTLPLDTYVILSLAIFWLIGFASATHDIAADGYYMLALDSSDQSLYVGIRSAFYRLATIIGQGGIVMAAGWMETAFGDIPRAWAVTFLIMSLLFLSLAIYHSRILPVPDTDKPSGSFGRDSAKNSGKSALQGGKLILKDFGDTFASFFRKKDVWTAIAFMLLYRFPEAQLVKLINPFLLDSADSGGLGMTTAQVGLAYGTIGIIGLTLGGILGGILVSRYGLKKCLWPMALALTLPCAVFCWMSMAQPDPASYINLAAINLCIFIEQFGYGIGFTSFMLYMMYFAQGPSKTSHYAICTAFMALGMMIPGMFAGALQERIGYTGFFWWIMACCPVTLAVTALIRTDPSFGIKKTSGK